MGAKLLHAMAQHYCYSAAPTQWRTPCSPMQREGRREGVSFSGRVAKRKLRGVSRGEESQGGEEAEGVVVGGAKRNQGAWKRTMAWKRSIGKESGDIWLGRGGAIVWFINWFFLWVVNKPTCNGSCSCWHYEPKELSKQNTYKRERKYQIS